MKGAVGTPAAEETVVLTINAKPVKNAQELQAVLDTLEAGKNVSITFKSKGKGMVVEGVAKAQQ